MRLEELITAGAARMGCDLDPAAPGVLRTFYDFLEEKNRVMDLTAIKGEEDAARAHFLDSLSLLPYIPKGAKLADVGSGAGFPGMPLAIARRDVSVVLLESMQKRCDFLRAAASLEGMPNVNVVMTRAEEAGQNKEHREKYDVVTARAVARLHLLCELCLPLVKPGGMLIAMKGPGAEAEIAEAKRAIATLGGGEAALHSYDIPDSDRTRCLVVIKKQRPTPAGYPRRYAKIVKNPLV